MAVVGEAVVVVRARTTGVESDIKRAFTRAGGSAGAAGRSAGQKFSAGFNAGANNTNAFTRFSNGLRNAVAGAEAARKQFANLTRASYAVGTALSGAVGGISAMIGGLSALVGAAGGAAAALAAVGGAVASIGLGMGVAKLALGGVGKAVSALNNPTGGGGGGGSSGSPGTKGTPGTPGVAAHVSAESQAAYEESVVDSNKNIEKAERSLAQVIEQNRKNLIEANDDVRQAQLDLNEAIREGQDEIKQIGFDAEDAALDEKRAALELEKARKRLQAVQDLPPNDAAREAAELAYQEAELNFRKAKDASASLNAEQARLAKTGVAGTQAVQSAQSALAQAQKARSEAVTDALRDQVDAQEQLAEAQADAAKVKAEGPEVTPATEGTPGTPGTAGSGGSSGGGGGGVDPFAGLNEAQKNFAKFIASLKPKFDELKEIAANGFLPPLQQAIQTLVDRAFPTVAEGVGIIASSMGVAVISIAEAITQAEDLANLKTIFESSGVSIENLGRAAGSLFSSVLTILAAAAPLTERFTGFIADAAARFDAFLTRVNGTGELTDFFNTAGDIAADFGTIFGNIFAGFGAIIEANFGPGTGGQLMLDWLKTATQGFADMGSTVEGKANLKQYFLDVAKNAIPVFQVIGDIIKILVDLGANKSIGEAFEVLKSGMPALESILNKMADSAPAMAELVVTILDIIDAFQDTGAMDIFFDTLNSIATMVSDALGNDAVMAVTTFTGRITAVLLALGAVGKVGGFGFKVVAGAIGAITSPIGKLISGFQGVALGARASSDVIGRFEGAGKINSTTAAVGKMTSNFKAAATAIGSASKAAVLATAAFVKNAAQATASAAATVAKSVAEKAAAAASAVATAAQWLLNAALSANPIGIIIVAIAALVAGLIYFFTQTELGQAIVAGFVQFLGEAWTNISEAAVQTFTFLGDFFTAVWDGIRIIIDAALAIIITIVMGYLNFIVTFWTTVWDGIVLVITTIWTVITGVINTAITFVANIIQLYLTTITTIWNTVWNAIVTFITSIWNTIGAFIQYAIDNVRNIIANVLALIQAVWQGNWDRVGQILRNIWDSIMNIVRAAIQTVQSIISSVGNAIASIWNGIWSGIGSFFSGVWNNIIGAVQNIGNIFRQAFAGIADFVQSAFQSVVGAVRGPLNGVIGIVNRAIRSLNGLSVTIPDWVPGVGGQSFGLNIPTIPQLAKGGVVMPKSGGTLVNVAEAGRPERVEPLDANGLSDRDRAMIQLLAGDTRGVQIVVNAAPGQSETEIADIVNRRVAFLLRKGGVR